FPTPSAPSLVSLEHLIMPAIMSTAVSISMAKVFSRKHNYKVSSNQELLAYGIANVFSSFFKCYPCSGSLSRSVVQEGSGGKSQLVGGISCILLGIVIVALTPLFHDLPLACLAAIIVVNLKGLLFQVKDFCYYYRISKLECILWTITFVTVILFDVDIGLYAGVSTSFILNTIRTQKPRFVTLGILDDVPVYKDADLFPTAVQYPGIKILRFDESLYACNAPFFKRKFYTLLNIDTKQKNLFECHHCTSSNEDREAAEEKKVKYKFVILDCSPFNFIDTTGVKLLIQLYNDLKKRNINLYLCECRSEIRRTLELMKFSEKTDPDIMFVTTNDAVHVANAAMKNSGAT
ncbi:unnamed protein product, partial [Didymodactylos carnosus]